MNFQSGTQTDGSQLDAAELYAPIIADIIGRLEPEHLLDYGCGEKVRLAEQLRWVGVTHRFKYQAFDSEVERYAGAPIPSDVVVCLDRLNESSEEGIDDLLDELRMLVEAFGFFSFRTDTGRLQRPAEWWLPRLMCRFELQTYQVTGPGSFYVVVTAQPGVIEGTDGMRLS